METSLESQGLWLFSAAWKGSQCDSGCEEAEEGNDLNLTKKPRIFTNNANIDWFM